MHQKSKPREEFGTPAYDDHRIARIHCYKRSPINNPGTPILLRPIPLLVLVDMPLNVITEVVQLKPSKAFFDNPALFETLREAVHEGGINHQSWALTIEEPKKLYWLVREYYLNITLAINGCKVDLTRDFGAQTMNMVSRSKTSSGIKTNTETCARDSSRSQKNTQQLGGSTWRAMSFRTVSQQRPLPTW